MIDPDALEIASQVIEKRFSDLSDLHSDLQNTIANIYYQGALIGMNPQGAILGGGIDEIHNRTTDAAFIVSAVESLPEIIQAFREDVLPKGNQPDIDLMTETFLLMFKYRLSLGSKPLFVLRLQKKFKGKQVDEIKGLYSQMIQHMKLP